MEGIDPVVLSNEEAVDIWAQVLKNVVGPYGMIDFKKAAEESSGLSTYISYIAEVGPYTHPGKFPTQNDKWAHYINSYNALAMYGIISKNFPADLYSVWDRHRFFSVAEYPVAGKEISLHEYASMIIDSMHDPRVHFALNCLTMGCPRLFKEPFEGAALDKQLDRAALEFMNTPFYVEVDVEDEVVRVAEIFEMYAADFADPADPASLITYINQYRRRKIPESYRIVFKPHNWYVKRQELSPVRAQQVQAPKGEEKSK